MLGPLTTRTAPRARCSAGPARPSRSWSWSPAPATGWARRPGQEVRGFCFGLSSPHPMFLFPSFCLLVWHWGWSCYNLLAFSLLGRLPLTDPNPEQKSRRGSPSLRVQPPTSRSAEGSGLPQVWGQGRSCLQGLPALQVEQGGEWNLTLQGLALTCCHFCS